MDQLFSNTMHIMTRALEAAGVFIIIAGTVFAAGRFLRQLNQPDAYHELRSTIGRAILLGLELLIAADIVNTVAIEPNLQNLAVLAGIVLIRTFLSFSLEVEIEGRWPWQRHSPEVTDTSNDRHSKSGRSA